MKPDKLYIIRGPDGKPQAIHQRTDGPDGKSFAWWSAGPGGQPVKGLQGRKVETLPLFGSQQVAKWDTSRPVYLVEGEKCAMALLEGGHRALGALGSNPTPSDASLAVLIGLDVVLWADPDEGGRKLMLNIAKVIGGAVASLRWIEWPDGDAADYLAAGLRVEDLAAGPVPTPEPVKLAEHKARPRRAVSAASDSPIQRFNGSVTVSDVLHRDYGIEARPGRAVRCPFHDDRHPSLSVLTDDRRAYCHSGGCWANNNGRGRDAWDLAHAASGTVAR